jgi:hypothetical protein
VSDRDPAGSKECTDPWQFFGHKNVPFEANRQYVSVRDCFATDRLFPDEWIAELHEQHSAWFDTFPLDAVDNSLASRSSMRRPSWLMSPTTPRPPGNATLAMAATPIHCAG